MNDVIQIEEKMININTNIIDDLKIIVSLFLKKEKNYSIFIRLFFASCIALPEKIEELCLFFNIILNFNCIEEKDKFFSIFFLQLETSIYKSREIKFAISYLIGQQNIPIDLIDKIKPLITFKHEDFLAIDGEKIQIDEKFHENQIKKGKSPSIIVESIRNDDIQSLITFFNDHNENDIKTFIIEKNIYERCDAIVEKKCHILDCAAFFGSVKCFKYLIMNKSQITHSTFNFAIMGGNLEIIHLIENELDDITTTIKKNLIYTLSCAIKYHRTEIFEWMMDHIKPIEIETIQYLILVCASYSNYIIFNNYLLINMDFFCLNTMFSDEKIFDWIITERVFALKRQMLSEEQIISKYKSIISQLLFITIHSKQLDCLKVIVKNSPFIGEYISAQFVEIIIKEMKNDNDQIIHYLLNCGIFNINMKCKLRRPDHFSHLKYNNQCKSLLLFACDSNNEKLIEELIQINAIDFNSECQDDDFKIRNAFDSVCENCTIRIINLFLIHFKTKLKFNLPLHFSCRGGKIENLEFVLSKPDININKVDHKKRTCLHYACQINSVSFLQKILSNQKTEFNLKDEEENTPFFTSLKSGSIECIKYLLSFNNSALIDINENDAENNDTPLHIATKKSNIEIIKLVLPNQNLEINKQNNQGIFKYLIFL